MLEQLPPVILRGNPYSYILYASVGWKSTNFPDTGKIIWTICCTNASRTPNPDSRLSFIVPENCPGAKTGAAKVFANYDGCTAHQRENPRRWRNPKRGCNGAADNFLRSGSWFWKSFPNNKRLWRVRVHSLLSPASAICDLLFLSVISPPSFPDGINLAFFGVSSFFVLNSFFSQGAASRR